LRPLRLPFGHAGARVRYTPHRLGGHPTAGWRRRHRRSRIAEFTDLRSKDSGVVYLVEEKHVLVAFAVADTLHLELAE
jgi:hypothetical protein